MYFYGSISFIGDGVKTLKKSGLVNIKALYELIKQ